MTKNPMEILKTDPINHRLDPPIILLKSARGKTVIGSINYYNLKISVSGSTIDEVSFNVYKSADDIDQFSNIYNYIESGKIIDVVGYGQFEINVTKKTDDETNNIIKVVYGRSLECELQNAKIYELHINDDDYFNYETAELSGNLDSSGNVIPITLYKPSDPDHSIIHLVLADKYDHWTIAQFPTYITVIENGEQTKELSSSFQRTFTIDGETPYDFLTGELANECNLVYYFDTYNRKIYVYDSFELGEDTNVFINTRNLANQITVEDNKDNLINCLKVEGGDDVITNYLSAVNINGNYIWQFSDIQLNDMPNSLRASLQRYIKKRNSLEDDYYGGYDIYNNLIANGISTDTILTYDGVLQTYSSLPSPSGRLGHYYYITYDRKYYVSNGSEWKVCGAFVRLCSAYDQESYLKDSMMPSTSLRTTTASEQRSKINNEFTYTPISVNNLSLYNSSSFLGITNNVVAYAKVLIDNRYTVESVEDITNNYPNYNNGVWNGKLHVYKTTDTSDTNTFTIQVRINEDAINFAKQKILKTLAKNDMADTTSNILVYQTSINASELRSYFSQYCLNSLKNFYEGYQNCLSTLMSMDSTISQASSIYNTIYNQYKLRHDVVKSLYEEREIQVQNVQQMILDYEREVSEIQESADLKTFLGSDWDLFCSYRREDVYQNSNFVSDGLTDGEIIAKCKELLDYAQYQLSMSCQLQRTLSIDLANLLIMQEFKTFWGKFSLYNYIRVEMDDEILKLRLLQIDIDFDSIDQLVVTFAENISGNGNILNDINSVIKQAATISGSYSFTKNQAKQGKKASNEVADIIDNGLKAAKTTIKNADNEIVTINNFGILCKDETDEGAYGDSQVIINGAGFFFTEDGWDTVSCALGRIYIGGKPTTGLIAKNVIGEMIAGNNLIITNEHGSFKLTGDNATFTNISINYNDNNGNSIRIGGDADGHLISIKRDNEERFYYDNNARQMVFKGDIYADNGTFHGSITAGSSITSSDMYASNIHSSNLYTGYIESTEINNGNGTFHVDSNGNMWARNGYFNGNIESSTINIGSNFKVDIYGNMTANNGTFKGKIEGGSITGTSFESVGNTYTTAIDSGTILIKKNGTYPPYENGVKGLIITDGVNTSEYTQERTITPELRTPEGYIDSIHIGSDSPATAAMDVYASNPHFWSNLQVEGTITAGKIDLGSENYDDYSVESGASHIGGYGIYYLDRSRVGNSTYRGLAIPSIAWVKALVKNNKQTIDTSSFVQSGQNNVLLNCGGFSGYAVVTSTDTSIYRISNESSASTPHMTIRVKNGTGSATHTINYTDSDKRLKTNIINSNVNGINTIKNIKIKQFDWIGNNFHWNAGIIADDLELIDDSFVNGGGYDEYNSPIYKSINTLPLIAYIIKAIQEQQDIIESQTQKLITTQGELSILKQKLEKLEEL